MSGIAVAARKRHTNKDAKGFEYEIPCEQTGKVSVV